MKDRISDGSAASIAMLAAAARVFCGLALDSPAPSGSGWISALLGGLLAMPLAFAAKKILADRRDAAAPADAGRSVFILPVCAVVLTVSLLEAGLALRKITTSANYIALTNSPRIGLILPPLLLGVAALLSGGDNLGSSAGIWSRILLALCILIFLLEFGSYRPEWIFPLLGRGASAVLTDAVRAAGRLSLIFLAVPFCRPGDRYEKTFSLPAALLISALAAAALLLTRSMMSPPSVGGSEFARLDTLLSNGRAPLSMQLPATVVWFIGLFYLLLFHLFCGASALGRLVPKLPRPVVILAVPSLTAVVSLSGIDDRTAENAALLLYAVMAAVILLVFAAVHRPKGGRNVHA